MTSAVASGVVLLIIALIFIVPAVVLWLWNITMPQVFGLRTVSYWQSFRLCLLAGILFGAMHASF
jgi:hypothetical protein